MTHKIEGPIEYEEFSVWRNAECHRCEQWPIDAVELRKDLLVCGDCLRDAIR